MDAAVLSPTDRGGVGHTLGARVCREECEEMWRGNKVASVLLVREDIGMPDNLDKMTGLQHIKV